MTSRAEIERRERIRSRQFTGAGEADINRINVHEPPHSLP